MVTVTCFLDTSADMFGDWLSTRWSALSANCVFDTRNGTVQLQALRDTQQNQTRTLAATLAFTSPIYPWQHYPSDAIGFELSPIAESRVEVRISCLSYDLLPGLVDLLSKMVKRWSVMRDTLEVAIGKLPTDENEQQALIAFSHHMRYLKIKPGQSAAMYGQLPAQTIKPTLAYLQPQDDGAHTADGETPRDAEPAETITGLPADKEAELRRLWPDNSLTHTQIAQKIGAYDGDTTRKMGYKLGLPKRKSGRKSGK